MKQFLLLVIVLLYGSLSGQNQNVGIEKLEKENIVLRNQNTVLQSSLDQCIVNSKKASNNIESLIEEINKSNAYVKLLVKKNSQSDSLNISLLEKLNNKFQPASLKESINSEIEKWIMELHNNGEVGPPCSDDYHKWMQLNPNYYYGLQKIKSFKNSTNNNSQYSQLFFFPAINCVGGSGGGSDFGILLYDQDGVILTNKNITKQIENTIKESIGNNIYHIQIYYTSFLEGKYSIWTDADPSCCPSIAGKFKYDAKYRKIHLSN